MREKELQRNSPIDQFRIQRNVYPAELLTARMPDLPEPELLRVFQRGCPLDLTRHLGQEGPGVRVPHRQQSWWRRSQTVRHRDSGV